MLNSEMIYNVSPYYVLVFEGEIKYRFGKTGVGFVDFCGTDKFRNRFKKLNQYEYPAMIEKVLKFNPFPCSCDC